MGCDIHLHVERRTESGWETIEPPHETKYGRTWSTFWTDRERPDPEGRNYGVFAFVAGVRNYYEPTEEPQFRDRGIPPGCTFKRDANEGWRCGDWLGDHSYTWATLAELLAAPWPERLMSSGFRRWLDELAEYGDPETIRVVMGFDS